MNSEIRYIELKTGLADKGPAWIARVDMSKSGRTIYFNGLALKAIKGGGIGANYQDLESDNQYWISGVKRDSSNRHWAGSGKIMIERSLLAWFQSYVTYKNFKFLDAIADLSKTDRTRVYQLENTPETEQGAAVNP